MSCALRCSGMFDHCRTEYDETGRAGETDSPPLGRNTGAKRRMAWSLPASFARARGTGGVAAMAAAAASLSSAARRWPGGALPPPGTSAGDVEADQVAIGCERDDVSIGKYSLIPRRGPFAAGQPSVIKLPVWSP